MSEPNLTGALSDLAAFLELCGVPYMVIGGYANLHWGRPRLTQDLDVTILVADSELSGFVQELEQSYQILVPDPVLFARQTRVIPIRVAGEVRADLILAGIAYEERAIRRAVSIPLESRAVRVCTAEDLVLHKLVSERARDREDVEGIIFRQGGRLDREYLDPLVDEATRSLDRPEIGAFYRSCLERAEGIPPTS